MMLTVQVVYCPAPNVCHEKTVGLPDGATLRDAIEASGFDERHGWSKSERPASDEAMPEAGNEAADRDGGRFGVWGRLKPLEHPLRDGDRVEVYRPLLIDPMEARRRRQKTQRNARP